MSGAANLDDACWKLNNFTEILTAWAQREGIVIHVAGDKAYARIDSPPGENHLKFLVTGINNQTEAPAPGTEQNWIHVPSSKFRTQRATIENSFRDQKVNRRFVQGIDRTSSYHLNEETTVVAVAQNIMLKYRTSKQSTSTASEVREPVPKIQGKKRAIVTPERPSKRTRPLRFCGYYVFVDQTSIKT